MTYIYSVGFFRRNIAGAAEPCSKTDRIFSALQRIVVRVVLSIMCFQCSHGFCKILNCLNRIHINARFFEVIGTVSQIIRKNRGFLYKSIDCSALICDQSFVIRVVIDILLQIRRVFFYVRCKIHKCPLRSIHIGLYQLGHHRIRKSFGNNSLINLRIHVIKVIRSFHIFYMNSRICFCRVIPFEFFDPVYIGISHKHGIAVVTAGCVLSVI